MLFNLHICIWYLSIIYSFICRIRCCTFYSTWWCAIKSTPLLSITYFEWAKNRSIVRERHSSRIRSARNFNSEDILLAGDKKCHKASGRVNPAIHHDHRLTGFDNKTIRVKLRLLWSRSFITRIILVF